MIVREAKLLNGTKEQYQSLDEAILRSLLGTKRLDTGWIIKESVKLICMCYAKI